MKVVAAISVKRENRISLLGLLRPVRREDTYHRAVGRRQIWRVGRQLCRGVSVHKYIAGVVIDYRLFTS